MFVTYGMHILHTYIAHRALERTLCNMFGCVSPNVSLCILQTCLKKHGVFDKEGIISSHGSIAVLLILHPGHLRLHNDPAKAASRPRYGRVTAPLRPRYGRVTGLLRPRHGPVTPLQPIGASSNGGGDFISPQSGWSGSLGRPIAR